MTGRGRGRSGGPRGPPPQAYGVGRGSRGPPGAQNLRPPPPPPGAPPGAPSSRPPAPRRPAPANLSNIEDAESIAAGSGSTVSMFHLYQHAFSIEYVPPDQYFMSMHGLFSQVGQSHGPAALKRKVIASKQFIGAFRDVSNHRSERCDIFRNLIPILTKGTDFTHHRRGCR